VPYLGRQQRSSGQTPAQPQASWQWQRLSFFAWGVSLGCAAKALTFEIKSPADQAGRKGGDPIRDRVLAI
jgi:hypothetical protein